MAGDGIVNPSLQVDPQELLPAPSAPTPQTHLPAPAQPLDSEEDSGGRVWNIISWILTIAAAAAVIALIKWSGLSLNTVATDSMMPTYKPTDIVIMLSPELVEPTLGSPIVFETEFAGEHIPPHVHRIIAQNNDGTFQTQGDNNDRPDPWVVRQEGIQGVVVAAVPGALIRSPLLLGGLLFLIVVVAFWPRSEDEDEEDEILTPRVNLGQSKDPS